MFATAVLYRTAWRRHRMLRRSLAAGLFAFELLVAGVYGTSVGDALSLLLSGVRTPRFVQALIGGSEDVFSPGGWLAIGYVHPLPLVLVITWAVAVASAAAAGEVEDGTAEFLASRPIDRRAMLAARVLVWGSGTAVMLGAGYLGTLVGTTLVAELSSFDRVCGIVLPAALVPLLVSIAGVAFLGSAVSSRRSRAVAVGVAFAVVSYFLNFAAVLWRPLEPLAPLSMFHYLAPAEWLRDGVSWRQAGVPTLVGLALFAAALEAFHRRDIAP